MERLGTDRSSSPIRRVLRWFDGTVGTYLRIWATVLVTPWVTFRSYVAPRDQTRAIGFTMVVITGWLLLGITLETASYPELGDLPIISLMIWLILLALFVAPVAIHLLAFLATLILMAIAPERGRVSETVQVIAFSMAPAVFIAVPLEVVQLIAAIYGTVLLVYGISVVHQTSFLKALLVAVLPAYLLYGIGFDIFEIIIAYLQDWHIV